MKPSNSSIVAKVTNFLMQSFDQNDIEELARSTGFVRKRSKITGFVFAMAMIFELRQPRIASLNELSTKLGIQGIPISKQGVDNRFNEAAVSFMKQLTDKVLSARLDRVEVLDNAGQFNRIMIKDSTVFQLPGSCAVKYVGSGGGASVAGMKLQYEYDLKAQGGLDIQEQPSRSPDNTQYLKAIQPNDLCLEDLGYFTRAHLEDIIDKKAYFLSRMKYSVIVFIKRGDHYYRLNMDQLVNKMKQGQIMELQVYLGQNSKVPIRLILERVPDEVASEKRRKLKTDKQNKRKGISKGRLAFCAVNAFITNADKRLLPSALIRSIYSLRWQIEIIFKTWKSTFHLDKVHSMKLQRFECVNYGTLLQIILCTKLFTYYRTMSWNRLKLEISDLKSMKYLLTMLGQIRILVTSRATKKMNQLLLDAYEILVRKCKKERKKGRQTPMMIMNQLSLA
jgi:hypothetical protein